jgi:hypothetical protein
MQDFELEFRDGKRVVAPHVYEMLKPIETYRLTFEEAMRQANNSVLSGHINKKADAFIARHFKENT